MISSIISIQNAYKKFGSKILLEGFHLEINKGDFISFVGLNGTGKTTLAEIILGIKKLDKGDVLFYKKNIKKGAVFQESNFNSILNIQENINFFKKIYGLKKFNSEQMLTQFNLLSEKKTKYRNLSAGQKQKFKLLIALMHNPDLVILDEISTSLDYVWKKKIIYLIKNYHNHNNSTIILVSHNFDEIAELSSKVYYFAEGRNPKKIIFQNRQKLLQKLNQLIPIENT